MAFDLKGATAALREGPLVDQGLLKAGGRAEVLAAIERWNQRGLRAHVFITARDEELAPWHALWGALALEEKKDLLLLFNGTRWDARGWNLNQPRIEAALRNAEPGLHAYYARGLVVALDQLGASATGTSPSPPPRQREAPAGDRSVSQPEKNSGFGIATGVALAVPAAALFWVLRRRKKIAADRYAGFEKTRLLAEQTYADVMLAAEALSDRGAEERQRASELKNRLDRLGRQAAERPMAADDPVLLGKVQQLDNEMTALHSTILQKAKGS
jgi:hypothetical protein